MFKKLVPVSGVLNAAAYINNSYLKAGDECSFEGLVTSRGSQIPTVLELNKESKELVEKTVKELKALETKSKIKVPATKAPKADGKEVAPAANTEKSLV